MSNHQTDRRALPATSRSLPFVLLRARERVMAPIRRMLSDSNITEQQWRVLRVLSEGGPMDASTLAERACLLFPSLTRIAFGMKNKGLISQVVDPKDRRRQLISITASGQKIIDRNFAEASQIAQAYRDQLGDENYDRLIDLLQMLESQEAEPSTTESAPQG